MIRFRRVRYAVGILASFALLLAVAPSAFADPINNPNAQFFTATCGDEVIDVVVTSGNPAHLLGSTRNFIPTEFTFSVTVDDQVVFSESATVGKGNKTGLQDRLVTCTTEVPAPTEEGLPEGAVFQLAVTGFFTPGHR